MPGVITSQSTVSPTSRPAPPEGRWFAAGVTDHGPVTVAVRVRSLIQFIATFGPQVAYSALYSQLRAFFGEGGYEAWIGRVVGPAAAAATISLDAGKLVITAIQPGAFANGWTAAYTAATKTLVIVEGTVTETYTGADLAGLLAAAAASTTVTVTSSGTLPAANVAATALAGGTDDRDNITSADVAAALALFEYEQGRGAVSAPGWPVDVVGAALIAHAAANGRVVLAAGDRGDTLTDLSTAVDAFTATAGGRLGTFWPWVQIPDAVTLSPEGAVAGKRASIIRDKGVWHAPAGGNGALTYVTGVDQSATRADIDTAHDAHAVNAIRLVAGVPTVYGWRAATDNEAVYRYLTVRDVEDLVRQDLEAALEQYVYADVDDRLIPSATGAVEGVLKKRAAAGAFSPLRDDDGTVLDPGWSVQVGVTINEVTPTIATLNVITTIRPVGSADTVQLGLVTVPIGTALAA